MDTATALERLRTGPLTVPFLRSVAKECGRGHDLAVELWTSGDRRARYLATMVEDPARVTRLQMEQWVRDLDSWSICDACTHNVFRYTPFAYEKAARWARAKPEFVRRAGFALMAGLAISDKQADDGCFEAFFPLMVEAATDERHFVKKAVNWALRQVGKRNDRLLVKAIGVAEQIRWIDSPSARWIASDALRELRAVCERQQPGPKKNLPQMNTDERR
jgi:3-methyladenine DNA glycosylase AlkD